MNPNTVSMTDAARAAPNDRRSDATTRGEEIAVQKSCR